MKNKHQIGDRVKLKTYYDLENSVHIEYLPHRDLLGQEVKIVDVLISQKINFYGVQFSGNLYYYIESKAGSRFLIEPLMIQEDNK